jgi:hypothetical protein
MNQPRVAQFLRRGRFTPDAIGWNRWEHLQETISCFPIKKNVPEVSEESQIHIEHAGGAQCDFGNGSHLQPLEWPQVAASNLLSPAAICSHLQPLEWPQVGNFSTFTAASHGNFSTFSAANPHSENDREKPTTKTHEFKQK